LVTEAFGISAGGLVVPGYMALKLMQPANFTITILVALATFAIIRAMSSFTVIFGRRMTALTILTAYLLGALLELAIGGGVVFEWAPEGAALVRGDSETDNLNQALGDPVFVELGVIGYIIPGLIALWFNRQGIMQTLSALIITSVLVRLSLIIIAPEAMIAYESGEIPFSNLVSRMLSGGAP
jgi:poly-gamma-glutamate biosynthesis protein PgsC/CapC